MPAPPFLLGTLAEALGGRITELNSDPDDDRYLVNIGSYVEHSDVIENEHMLRVFINMKKDNFGCLMKRQAMKEAVATLDEQYNYKLSGASVIHKRQQWAKDESMKIRMIWSYFLSLCARSSSSRSKIIAHLKFLYFDAKGMNDKEKEASGSGEDGCGEDGCGEDGCGEDGGGEDGGGEDGGGDSADCTDDGHGSEDGSKVDGGEADGGEDGGGEDGGGHAVNGGDPVNASAVFPEKPLGLDNGGCDELLKAPCDPKKAHKKQRKAEAERAKAQAKEVMPLTAAKRSAGVDVPKRRVRRKQPDAGCVVLIDDDDAEPRAPFHDAGLWRDRCRDVTTRSCERVQDVDPSMMQLDGVVRLVEDEFGPKVCESLRSLLARCMDNSMPFAKLQPHLKYSFQRDKHIFQIKLNNKATVQAQDAESPDNIYMVARILFYLTAAGVEKPILEAAKKTILQ